ncbi:MAG: hypothetical protein M1821_009613 [Bathelium mastoideum]|nr:MAG: hypothetical protein M1821_009613 [Bathelium mastoideum]KAI9688838.1 MAG: hypothetical protein M1822_001195 [Bathelium mastoideum]
MATPASQDVAGQFFSGRTVVVSGATGKLGRPICTALASAGANVVINDINKEAVQELLSSIISLGYSAIGVTLSATSGSEIVFKAVQHFGRVDAVINLTLGPISWKPIEELAEEDFRIAYEANVVGPISIIKAAWLHFKSQGYGRVVNFTSDSMLGMPTGSVYTNTKGALFGVNKTLAMEGAPFGIKVNCVSPIAYVPSMERHIARFSQEVQNKFKSLYTPEANVPMVLALASEGCRATGEVFNTAGWAAGRSVWSYQKGMGSLETIEACLKAMDEITKKGEETFEPQTMVDFTEWQAKYGSRQATE